MGDWLANGFLVVILFGSGIVIELIQRKIKEWKDERDC